MTFYLYGTKEAFYCKRKNEEHFTINVDHGRLSISNTRKNLQQLNTNNPKKSNQSISQQPFQNLINKDSKGSGSY